MIELFCKKTNCEFGSVLKIGSGEAILKTPFKIFVTRKVKKLANSIRSKNYKTLHKQCRSPQNYLLKHQQNIGLNMETEMVSQKNKWIQ